MLQYAIALLAPSRRIIIAAVVALVIGCLIGWIVFGWLIWPVSWTDADPYDMRQEHKETWVSMVADSYSVTFDAELARQRLAGFEDEEVRDILAGLIQEREQVGDNDAVGRLQSLVSALDISLEGATPVAPEATPAPTDGDGGIVGTILSFLPACGVLVIVLLIVALIAIVVYRFLMRPTAAMEEAPPETIAEELVPWEVREEAPLGHFVTTYHFGDDGYDTSFNIETPEPEGEFHGACGVGFSERLGEGSPEKIVAFEIWIFDKTDLDNVQTVTQVLMSEFAYDNEILRAKMKDRGEAVLAERGKTIVVEAVGMNLNVEIVDMAYGTDPSLPPNSYFETLTTELVPVLKT